MSRQVFRPRPLGDVHDRHHHPIHSSRRRRERHRQQHRQRLTPQRPDHGFGLVRPPALGDGDQRLDEGVSRLGREALVQGSEKLLLSPSPEQPDRHVVDVHDLHHPDGALDKVRVRGHVVAEVPDASGSQIVDRQLHLGEVILPDRHVRRVEDVAVPPLTLAKLRLRLLAQGDVVVGLQDRPRLAMLIVLQRPAARHHRLAAVGLGVDELTVPAAGLQQFRLDLLDRRREDGLHEPMRHLAHRFLGRPPVELLGRAVPVGDDVGHVAHEDGVVGEIQQARLFAQRGLGVLAGGDVDHDAPEPAGASSLLHHRHKVAQPHDASVRREHPVFEVVAALGGGPLAEWHRPVAIVRVNVILPEGRLGQPALPRIAKDALGLIAHERELKGRGVRFPHDAVDRVDQVLEARRSLADASLEVIAGARQRVLRLAARSAHRRHEHREEREDDQARELGGVDLRAGEGGGEVVLEGHGGQAPGHQRRPQAADPSRDQHGDQQQLSGGQRQRSQLQRQQQGDDHARDRDAVAGDRGSRDVLLHAAPPQPCPAERAPHAVERAVRTASTSAALWKGFLRNATAPACRVCRRVSSSP